MKPTQTDKPSRFLRLVRWLKDRLGIEVTDLGEEREDHVPRSRDDGPETPRSGER